MGSENTLGQSDCRILTTTITRKRWDQSSQPTFIGLQDMFKMFTVYKMFAKCLLGISASNKSKFVSNKSIFHKSVSGESKVNPKCIN